MRRTHKIWSQCWHTVWAVGQAARSQFPRSLTEGGFGQAARSPFPSALSKVSVVTSSGVHASGCRALNVLPFCGKHHASARRSFSDASSRVFIVFALARKSGGCPIYE
eukprot:977934-Alexandrium_andersonii.AAC.1